MAGGGDWNSFLQSRRAQLVMYGLCVFFCVYYAVDAVIELFTPERSANLIQMMGEPGFYAMTIIRVVVLLVTAFMFGRMMLKRGDDNDE